MPEIPARVLIVDDDDRSRAVASSLLRGKSNHVDFAASATEALEIARQWRPDLILLDVMMPDVDGFEACRRIRADPELADIRVFMLTALDDSASRLTAFEAGADDFITKPLDRVETLARIQGIARLNRYRDFVRHRREIRLADGKADESAPPILEVEHTLEEAVETMTLWFQPVFMRAPGFTGVFAHEALIRTANEILTHPAALLSAARNLGQMEQVSLAVRRLLAAAADEHPRATFFLNVNAAEFFDDSLYADDDVLAPFATRVILEITEREPVVSVSELKRRITALRRRGYRIAIDDLGAGFSSLESLVLVEPDFVKLEGRIIQGLDRDSRQRTVVATLITLARELGIEIVAEGVETAEERRALEKLGFRYLQGYYHGRPGPELSEGPAH